MYTAKIGYQGGGLPLDLNYPGRYEVLDITGLDTGVINISTFNIAGADGSVYSSAKIPNRNIVITVKILGDVPTRRRALYMNLPLKKPVTFYFKNEIRDVKIDGYVENISCPQFTDSEIMQISLICPNPAFIDATGTSLQFTTSTLHLSYLKPSVGMKIQIEALAGFTTFGIQNTATGEELSFTAVGAAPGNAFIATDLITVDTRKGQKSVTLTRYVDNVGDVNIMSGLDIDSDFLQINEGVNDFAYKIDGAVDTTKAKVTLIYADEYEGT